MSKQWEVRAYKLNPQFSEEGVPYIHFDVECDTIQEAEQWIELLISEKYPEDRVMLKDYTNSKVYMWDTIKPLKEF